MTTEGSQVLDDDADGTGDTDGFDAVSFEPAVSVTGADEPTAPQRVRTARSGARRRLGAGAVLLAALVAMGGGYSLLAGSSTAADTTTGTASDIAAGRQLYQSSCITCHGANLEGVKGNGPSLINVGAAAAYFQVGTGRMPLAQQGAQADRKQAKFDDKETRQLAAFIESVGGGPELPSGTIRGTNDMIALGGKVYRLNCASCHGATGKGAPLSAGKGAPSLNAASDLQIWTAMLSGPESMPVFGNNSITPQEKQAIIAYIQFLKATKDPGGNGIDRIGPVSEAIVIWAVGVGLLMVTILWIGARSR